MTAITDMTMSWEEIQKKHKEKYQRTYVACHEPYERDYLIDMIRDCFPNATKDDIEEVINIACKMLPTPRNSELFMKFVVENLK
jgi:hypothetical protein